MYQRIFLKIQTITKTDLRYLTKSSFWLFTNYATTTFVTFLLAVSFANILPKDVFGTSRRCQLVGANDKWVVVCLYYENKHWQSLERIRRFKRHASSMGKSRKNFIRANCKRASSLQSRKTFGSISQKSFL